MTDDVLDDLDPDVADLLEAYASETARSPAQVEAALTNVTAKVAGTAGAGAAAAGLSTTAKVGLAATVLGIAGVVGLALATPDPVAEPVVQTAVATSPEPAPEPEPEPEPVEADDGPMAPPPIAKPKPAPEPVERPAPTRTKRVKPETPDPKPAPKPAPADTLAEELRLLQQVRAAIRKGENKRARTLMSEHRERFPTTAVARERQATMIVLQCAEGRDDDARRTAQAYNRRYSVPTEELLAGCDD